MVVFGAAGSVPKTSRAFVVVVLGFFCSVCRDERNESIFCVDAAFFAALLPPTCAALAERLLRRQKFAAIVYTRLRRVISVLITGFGNVVAMNGLLRRLWLTS